MLSAGLAVAAASRRRRCCCCCCPQMLPSNHFTHSRMVMRHYYHSKGERKFDQIRMAKSTKDAEDLTGPSSSTTTLRVLQRLWPLMWPSAALVGSGEAWRSKIRIVAAIGLLIGGKVLVMMMMMMLLILANLGKAIEYSSALSLQGSHRHSQQQSCNLDQY